MANVALGAIVGGSVVVKKSAVISASGNWTAPLALAGGTAYVTGCAGGGSGAFGSAITSVACGGCGGGYCQDLPVTVTAGSVYAVVIGAGGAASGGNGGDTTFGGSLVVLKGGRGGRQTQLGVADLNAAANYMLPDTGILPPKAIIPVSAASAAISGFVSGQTVNGNVPGASVWDSADSTSATGGAAGFFGSGTGGSTTVSTAAAAAGSGAGSGGAVSPATASGAGGSGKIIVTWWEFL